MAEKVSGVQAESGPITGYNFGPENRTWGVTVFRNAKGAPMVSLGIHADFHTPSLDIFLPLTTVRIGRNVWNGKRFTWHSPEPWSGHMDDCRCKQRGARPVARTAGDEHV